MVTPQRGRGEKEKKNKEKAQMGNSPACCYICRISCILYNPHDCIV